MFLRAALYMCRTPARYLSYVHAGVAGQRARRGQVVAAQHGGDDPVAVHLPDHRSVHEVDEPVFVNRNP